MRLHGLILLAGFASLTWSSPACSQVSDSAATERLYADAAARAWAFLDQNYQASTGLIKAHSTYPIVTTWDIASGIAGTYAANELGLLPDAEYDRRMRKTLQTLQTMPLYDGVAFNRAYSAETAGMIARGDKPTTRGSGWSTTDIGRLLSVLKVVSSNHRQYEGEIDKVVNRLDYGRLIKNGYLWGENVDSRGRVQGYPEGKIGYEQYAAAGFAVWGKRADRALNLMQNAKPVTVMGQSILTDKRGGDRLTSEPFVLMGLELDLWGKEMNELARAVLAVQEARYRQTGQITIVSEDALPDPPYYFYYYAVYHDGKEFVVDAQAPMRGVNGPRWISTKAAFGWNALFPSEYTRTAVKAVVDAQRGSRHWASGIYERTNRPAGTGNVNTSGVILEAALYQKQGRRLFTDRAAVPAAAPDSVGR